DPMGQREEQGLEVPADPARPDGAGVLAGCDDDERAPSGEAPVAVASGHAELGVEVAVGEAAGEYPVEPALEDGGRPVPPQRELDDEELGPGELHLLRADVGEEQARRIGLLRERREIARTCGEVSEVTLTEDG